MIVSTMLNLREILTSDFRTSVQLGRQIATAVRLFSLFIVFVLESVKFRHSINFNDFIIKFKLLYFIFL